MPVEVEVHTVPHFKAPVNAKVGLEVEPVIRMSCENFILSADLSSLINKA